MDARLKLTMDESMIFWVGTAEGKLMFIPGKPSPLSFMQKTLVDTTTGILVIAEIVERAEKNADKKKLWFSSYPSSTGNFLLI